MKDRISLFLVLLVLSVLFLSSCERGPRMSQKRFDNIVNNFKTPKDNNRIWTYYYWYNDNVSKEDITKDLEAMKKAGIGTVFIGNINWQGKDGKVPLSHC